MDIAAGANHSFATHRKGKAYGWGPNSHAQAGIARAPDDVDARTNKARLIKSLEGYGQSKRLDGGNFNSVAVTDSGECLVWGHIDNLATGVKVDGIPTENAICDTRDRKKILVVPTRIPGIKVSCAAAGGEGSIALLSQRTAKLTARDSAWEVGRDKERTTMLMIDNAAIRDQKIIWVGGWQNIGKVEAGIRVYCRIHNLLHAGNADVTESS